MAEAARGGGLSCFFEQDSAWPLARRTFVEVVGTAFLCLTLVSARLSVEHFAGNEPLVASLIVAMSVAGALVGLIVALGKVSGGHYNPIITISQWLTGNRSASCTIAYVLGQTFGAIGGAVLGSQMVADPVVIVPAASPTSGMLLSEVIASMVLMTIVFGCARSAKWETGPFAVGGWLTAGILVTPSTSYANPAITIAGVFALGPVTLSALTAASYIAAQLVGMLLAIGISKSAFNHSAPDDTSSDQSEFLSQSRGCRRRNNCGGGGTDLRASLSSSLLESDSTTST